MSKIVYRKKNFITPQEIEELNTWVDHQVVAGGFTPGISISKDDNTYQKRLTTRLDPDRYEYPELVVSIRDRIKDYLGLTNQPNIEGHGRDGVVVSCTLPGGGVYSHRDPPPAFVNNQVFNTFRCNILTRKSDSGGELYLEEQLEMLEVGELHCYFADLYTHRVTPVSGTSNRILWMFGCAVLEQELILRIKQT